MNDNGRWRNPESISAAQYAIVEAAAAREGVTFEIGHQDGHPLHFWQRDHILVTDDVDETKNPDLLRLGAVLAPDAGNGLQRVRKDMVKLLKLEKARRDNGVPTTREIVAELNTRKDLHNKVFVNNLMYVTHGDGANICPAAEPTPRRSYPQTKPYPPVNTDVDGGADVSITVIDTGMPRDISAHTWLLGNHVMTVPELEEEGHTYDGDGYISPHAGHGMFIAGVIRCVAPRARVRVLNSLRWSGSMTESGVAQAILDVLDEAEPPKIISLSAGYMVDHAVGDDPSAMRRVMWRLQQDDCDTVLVAATGNDGHGPNDHGLFYPAAFANECQEYVTDGTLIAVGALREDRKGRACFTNYGDWVTVYEEGENLVNVFPAGRYRYREPVSGATPPTCIYYPDDPIQQGCTCVSAPRQDSTAIFSGMAAWSGTSFATPLVVGRLARRMTELGTDASPRAAAQDLLKDRQDLIDAGDGETLRVFPEPAVG